MEASDALLIVDALDQALTRYWITGGWGVDALAGQRTRAHRDLDLAVDAETFAPARLALEALGFAAETDWLPVRLELAGGPGGWVDLHPVDFGRGPTGIQQGMDGTDFRYPAADLTTGRINDRAVPCISVRLQIHFHCGYEPRDQDRHDLELLAGLERPS